MYDVSSGRSDFADLSQVLVPVDVCKRDGSVVMTVNANHTLTVGQIEAAVTPLLQPTTTSG